MKVNHSYEKGRKIRRSKHCEVWAPFPCSLTSRCAMHDGLTVTATVRALAKWEARN